MRVNRAQFENVATSECACSLDEWNYLERTFGAAVVWQSVDTQVAEVSGGTTLIGRALLRFVVHKQRLAYATGILEDGTDRLTVDQSQEHVLHEGDELINSCRRQNSQFT